MSSALRRPSLRQTLLPLLGLVTLALTFAGCATYLPPGAKADLRARFPGKILSVAKNVGDKVRAGDVLARIESNESLQTYSITAPFDGVVLERTANAGDVTGDGVLFTIGALLSFAVLYRGWKKRGGPDRYCAPLPTK